MKLQAAVMNRAWNRYRALGARWFVRSNFNAQLREAWAEVKAELEL